MCESLKELMKEEFEECEQKAEKKGREAGEKLINELNQKLAKAGRINDIIRAATDKKYQEQLIKEFGL